MALVTGSARGIGAATARHLAGNGWRLVLFDRCADDPVLNYPLATPSDLEAVVTDCGGPDRALAVVGDVRDQGALDAAVLAAAKHFGGLDAAVAVAGCIVGGQPAWETTDEQWSTVLDVTLNGTFRTTRAAMRHMMPRGRGAIVNNASVVGWRAQVGQAHYAAAKAGVMALTRCAALSRASSG